MSGSIYRAFGNWVASVLPAFHVAADEISQRPPIYPRAIVAKIANNQTPLSCGITLAVKDEDGFQTHVGQPWELSAVYRVTLKAAEETGSENGAAVIDAAVNAIMQAVRQAAIANGDLTLTDTEVTPSVSFTIDRMDMTNKQDLPPEKNGKPFLHRAAISIEVSRTTDNMREVTEWIESVTPTVAIMNAEE